MLELMGLPLPLPVFPLEQPCITEKFDGKHTRLPRSEIRNTRGDFEDGQPLSKELTLISFTTKQSVTYPVHGKRFDKTSLYFPCSSTAGIGLTGLARCRWHCPRNATQRTTAPPLLIENQGVVHPFVPNRWPQLWAWDAWHISRCSDFPQITCGLRSTRPCTVSLT